MRPSRPQLTALCAQELEFDIPFRELAFPGVPYKTSSLVLPTVNCLVDLIETPFLVVTLKEIEVVNLERVGFALKNFDMAIVFKDFTKEVHRIDAIDSKNLDTIKEWLNSVGIKYYESKMNLNWKPILKTILVCGPAACSARLPLGLRGACALTAVHDARAG